MAKSFNIYCDESGHLPYHSDQPVMVLGCVWIPTDRVRPVNRFIRRIKREHGIDPLAEIKWTTVSPSGYALYEALIRFFFASDDLHFRGVIVPDKGALDHAAFGQDHDEWYYKMYFVMLKAILDPDAVYNIYLDIKDTRSRDRVKRLHDVLGSHLRDYSRRIVARVQHVRSDEVEILQLADLLIGAVMATNRGGSKAPLSVGLCSTSSRNRGMTFSAPPWCGKAR